METEGAATTQETPTGVLLSEPLFKARPATEGDTRFLYCEPSSGQWDSEGERMLAKALMDSAEHFLKFGVIDIGHFSMPVPKLREAARAHGYNPDLCRVGNPVDVRLGTEGTVVVKAEIFQGDSPAAEQANILWENLITGTRYYPSVGGVKLAKSCSQRGCVITAAKWTNIGLWPEPIDLAVKAVTITPMDVFAKALVAGTGTDVSALEGATALRRESIEGDAAYYLGAAAFLRGTPCPHVGGAPNTDLIKAHFRECCGFDETAAAAAAERLLWDLTTRLGASAPDTNRALAA